MVDAVTNNRNILQPQVGSDSGTWGGLLNSGVAAQLDLILGATQAISITGADVNLTISQWNNCAIKLTGALTGDRALILPLNANSATVAVGGLFVVDNQTTGAFNVTVKTIAAGSVGVTIPQGTRTFLYSDTVNVYYADDSRLYLTPYAGNPNGNVAGTAAAVNKAPSVVWDYTNLILYVCSTTGDATTAVWINSAATAATLASPQGYLTPTSNTPVIPGDVVATSIFYTPFVGTQVPIHNGTAVVPYTFSQLTLKLSTSQAANSIYDIFLAWNSGTPVIGVGPSWASGGGSIAMGTAHRGTGAGSTDITRGAAGAYWNTNSMNLTYNLASANVVIVVPANQALYLGSIYVDSTAGQVSCHRTIGRNRKWGVWNAYNRQSITLLVTDPGAAWTYNSATWRASRDVPTSFNSSEFNVGSGTACNSAVAFCGLSESEYNAVFAQTLNPLSIDGAANSAQASIGIGLNSVTAPSGKRGCVYNFVDGTGLNLQNTVEAFLTSPPSLGINAYVCLEQQNANARAIGSTFYGTNLDMQMSLTYQG